MTNDRVQLHVQVPASTKELAKQKLDHGGISRVVREELERVAHGGEATDKKRLKEHLRELRDGRSQLKTERDELNDRIADVERKIARAEDDLDAIRDREGEYEGALQMLEQRMRDDEIHVWEGHGRIQEIAELGNCSQADVIADLKDRNLNIPDERFDRADKRGIE